MTRDSQQRERELDEKLGKLVERRRFLLWSRWLKQRGEEKLPASLPNYEPFTLHCSGCNEILIFAASDKLEGKCSHCPTPVEESKESLIQKLVTDPRAYKGWKHEWAWHVAKNHLAPLDVWLAVEKKRFVTPGHAARAYGELVALVALHPFPYWIATVVFGSWLGIDHIATILSLFTSILGTFWRFQRLRAGVPNPLDKLMALGCILSVVVWLGCALFVLVRWVF